MDTKEWKELKNLLSSLLISSPLLSTVRMLNADYRNEVGCFIPYREFGFVTLEQCLDNMTDILQRDGSHIKVCVSQKSAHIDKLIARQVMPSNKQRTHRVPPKRQQRRHISSNYTSYNAPEQCWNGRTSAKTIPSLIPTSGVLMTPPMQLLRKVTSSELHQVHETSRSATENTKLKVATSMPQVSLASSANMKVNKLEDITNRDRLMVNIQIPLEVQKNLIDLIGRFNKGLRCAELPDVYQKLFKKELNYTNYGFKNLILMCMQLELIFYCHRPKKGDFILYDRKKPLPDNLDTDSGQASDARFELTPVQDVLKRKQMPLYPPDVLQLFNVIPKQFALCDTKKDDFIEVCLGDVYNPELFFVVLTRCSEDLDKLMDDMQIFYSKRANEFKIPQNMIKEHLYCVTIYDKEYHRAKIIQVLPEETCSVKVFCFDYGTVDYVKPSELYYLHKRFVGLPQQAIEARLAGIKPSKDEWSKEAAVELLNLTRDKHLYAHIFHVDRVRQRLDMFLVDTNDSTDIHLNDLLVTKGYALFIHQDVTKPVGKSDEVAVKDSQKPNGRKELFKVLTQLYCRQSP